MTSKWPEAGPVIPKQPPICTLLPFLPSAIIDCNSQLSSFPVFVDKTGREEGASLIRATESALLRSADGHPTDRENLAQRKIDPVGRRPHPRHVARGELWIVGIRGNPLLRAPQWPANCPRQRAP